MNIENIGKQKNMSQDELLEFAPNVPKPTLLVLHNTKNEKLYNVNILDELSLEQNKIEHKAVSGNAYVKYKEYCVNFKNNIKNIGCTLMNFEIPNHKAPYDFNSDIMPPVGSHLRSAMYIENNGVKKELRFTFDGFQATKDGAINRDEYEITPDTNIYLEYLLPIYFVSIYFYPLQKLKI